MSSWEFYNEDDVVDLNESDTEPSFSFYDFKNWLSKEKKKFKKESIEESVDSSKEELKKVFKNKVKEKVEKKVSKKLKERKENN